MRVNTARGTCGFEHLLHRPNVDERAVLPSRSLGYALGTRDGVGVCVEAIHGESAALPVQDVQPQRRPVWSAALTEWDGIG